MYKLNEEHFVVLGGKNQGIISVSEDVMQSECDTSVFSGQD